METKIAPIATRITSNREIMSNPGMVAVDTVHPNWILVANVGSVDAADLNAIVDHVQVFDYGLVPVESGPKLDTGVGKADEEGKKDSYGSCELHID